MLTRDERRQTSWGAQHSLQIGLTAFASGNTPQKSSASFPSNHRAPSLAFWQCFELALHYLVLALCFNTVL